MRGDAQSLRLFFLPVGYFVLLCFFSHTFSLQRSRESATKPANLDVAISLCFSLRWMPATFRVTFWTLVDIIELDQQESVKYVRLFLFRFICRPGIAHLARRN